MLLCHFLLGVARGMSEAMSEPGPAQADRMSFEVYYISTEQVI